MASPLWAYLVILLGLLSCKKQDSFLDVKSANSDVVPKTLKDFQALLDNDQVINGAKTGALPLAGLVGADNYFLKDATYRSLTAPSSTLYSWNADTWQGGASNDWSGAYKAVVYTNAVLEGIAKLPAEGGDLADYNNVKGSALFYRSLMFYNLSSLFCKPYDKTTAANDPGIVIRLTSNVNDPSTRATVAASYQQMITDLKTAIPLLPTAPLYKTRPSVPAAKALLAKIYLAMEQYDSALLYADAVLQVKGDLIDFNNAALVNKTSSKPFPSTLGGNPEVLFFAAGLGYSNVMPRRNGFVDSLLFASYDLNDLRRAVFYTPSGGFYQFKGTYDFYGSYNFCGIATNEIYLIRAECYARQGNADQAMADLSALLGHRYVTGTYVPPSTPAADSALVLVLGERRKELPFTANLRWEDLRRLNRDPRFAKTIQRNIAGTLYSLPPNDDKYVLPIPAQEIQLSHLDQNPR